MIEVATSKSRSIGFSDAFRSVALVSDKCLDPFTINLSSIVKTRANLSLHLIPPSMPESNAAAKRRQFKANRALGLGDDQGRMVRQKEPPKMSKCTVCQQDMKITKTNTELTAHATSKHNNTLETCFPGAADIAAEMIAVASKSNITGSKDQGMTKSQKKAKADAGLDDLLNSGLSNAKLKGKK